MQRKLPYFHANIEIILYSKMGKRFLNAVSLEKNFIHYTAPLLSKINKAFRIIPITNNIV